MANSSPLMFVLMAVSSVVFGALHCLAWNFEAPTRAELITWRVASLVMTIVPVATLMLNILLSYLSTNLIENRIISTAVARLQPLERLPAGWWDWRRSLPKEVVQRAESSQTWDARYEACYETLERFHAVWEDALRGNGEGTRFAFVGQKLRRSMRQAKGIVMGGKGALELWRRYEKSVGALLDMAAAETTEPLCVQHIARAYDHVSFMADVQLLCDRASTVLTIFTGVLYAASRLVIIGLMFSCLRAVPAGVYQNTPWTQVLPNMS